MTEKTNAPRKQRVPKTSKQLKDDLAKARAKLAELERKAYAEELGELIRGTNIVKEFKAIQSKVGDINPIAILEAVAKEVAIPRVTITQAQPTKRKPADPNKPRATRKKSASDEN